ncbi:growth hormone secretagogue receptor type 1 [Biomphalaria pfeifferi]|uniref:Growth hormone secretagogue receptor type 1 n=1 Tax=Biomphalaria pfeifferi TaxID=112525 RepID=A0AAD8EX90_BIOPF|nr:growth hormone secretagogue receptor type 1 [Biomphalaria pfeifferi]
MNNTIFQGSGLNGTDVDVFRLSLSEGVTSSPNVSYGDSAGFSSIYEAALIINEYYLWPIFAVGFPGNLASIVTIFRMRSVGSFTLYVVLLAIMDNCALLVKLIIYQLLRQKVNIGDTGCRAFIFLGTFCTTYANWILVLMAGERLIAVRFPLKIQKYLDYKKSIIWICVVGVLLFGAYTPILWFYSYESGSCTYPPDSMETVRYLHWSNLSLSAFIPFVCMSLFNVLIMRVIRQSFRLRNALRNVNSTPLTRRSSCHDVSTQRQIMLMLFTAAFVFVIFVFPLCALAVANVYVEHKAGTLSFELYYLCGQIAYVLFDSTHALNFYLYFLSARKFRHHFLRLTSCKSAKEKPITLSLQFRNQFNRMSLLTAGSTRPTAV